MFQSHTVFRLLYQLQRIETQWHYDHIEFYSISYAMFFSSIQLLYTVKVYVQKGIIAVTKSPYLQVFIYTLGKTISIYHLNNIEQEF